MILLNINVEPGDEVGTLPTITKGIYTFDGWYADSGFNTQVSATTIPTESTTYYAKWSYQASNTIDQFDITKDVMTTYYNNINTWKNDQTTFQTNMDTNFNNYSCSACNGPNDCSTPTTGDKCDQSRGYDTGVGEAISVYESDEVNKTKGNLVTYTTSTDGIIYNMIPGEVYYWEANSDSNVHGLVKALGKRRIINTTVRNIRDLGGLEVDTDNDGTVDGTLKYGRMFRGTKLANSTDIANLEKLGINLVEGNVMSTDCFDWYVKDIKVLLDRLPNDVIAAEMESFALLYTAKYLNKNASCLMYSVSLLTAGVK